MGQINIPRHERDALKQINSDKLYETIQECVNAGQATALHPFNLFNCGQYVNSKASYFERALIDYRAAKSAKKCADTRYYAQKAGSELIFAIQQMQARLQEEEEEELRFWIDDHIMQPNSFSEDLSVRINYRWRQTVDESWIYRSIVFSYRVDTTPDYMSAQTKRKQSSSQQASARQEKLRSEWNHLMSQGLFSLRDFFKSGGDGAKIPEIFQIRPDSYTRGLNNFSTRFWRE